MPKSNLSRSKIPVIGIDCSSVRPESPVLNPGSAYQNGVPLYYIKAIERAGGLPVLLPLIQKPALIASILGHIDGLLLSGGYDIDPGYFNQQPDPNLGTIDVDRDRFEKIIVPLALKQKNFPILGICRGIQALNVFAGGGTLFQDLSLAKTDLVKHQQKTNKPLPTHDILIESGTLLHSIFKKRRLRTNSYHHQVVDQIAPGFVVSARSTDGLIEGIEKTGSRFVIGFQPHPEQLEEEYPEFRKLFRAFVEAARNSGS